MELYADFPGGNILVDALNETQAWIRQDWSSSTRWWFYWNFKVKSEKDVHAQFHFTDGEVVGPLGPACRVNDGAWHYAGANVKIEDGFTFDIKAHISYQFSWAIPYQLEDYKNFVREVKSSPNFSEKILLTTKKGRTLPCVRLGEKNARHRMLITCRMHACESTASYVLEGFAREMLRIMDSGVLSDLSVTYIPFVDLDGVEDGEQGKCRAPHDHYQDYRNEPIYPITYEILKCFAQEQYDFYLDLHCPYMWARNSSLSEQRNDHPFLCCEIIPSAVRVERFGRHLEQITNARAGGIHYKRLYNLHAGQEWFTDAEVPGATHTYFNDHGVALSTSLEFSYFGAEISHEIGPVLAFGRDLAQAVIHYYQEDAV